MPIQEAITNPSTDLAATLTTAARLHNLRYLQPGLAHDLRSVLNSMGLQLTLLRRTLPEEVVANGRPRTSLQALERELSRLGEMLERHVTAIGTDKPSQSLFDLRELLAAVGAYAEPQCRQQRVKLELSSPAAAVPADGPQRPLELALQCLVVNALEAMPEGGTLKLTLTHEDTTSRITVTDTGSGIPATVRSQVFDLYFTTRPTNPGIGLHVARQVVHERGGSLELTSHEPPGSCFEMCLPLATEDRNDA